MKPLVYFDLEAVGGGRNHGSERPLLRGAMLAALHPLFAAQPHTYALSIPAGQEAVRKSGGGTLRVFASGRADLDRLAEALSRSAWLRDYAHLRYPLAVPADYAGPWAAFRRYRVPSLRSDRKAGAEHGQLRQRRMAAMAEERMDYFILTSTTTAQRFSLAVWRESGGPPQGECLPNSYGLCSAHNLFCVPDMP